MAKTYPYVAVRGVISWAEGGDGKPDDETIKEVILALRDQVKEANERADGYAERLRP